MVAPFHILKKIRLVIVAFSALPAGVGEARFLESDTELVDQEERLSTESYNDKISYRFPTPWDQKWDEAKAGYRISAGSLNANRFDIIEDIKFLGAGSGPVSFSFHHHKREDTVEQRLEQILRIDWLTPLTGLNLALMAEGGSKKEYGDLGTAIGFKPREDRLLEFYYWSVDHFYDTKKQYADDSRGRQTSTTGVQGDWRFTDRLRLRFDHQYDKPLSWDRQSEDYAYSYWRRTTDLRLDLGNAETISGYASLSLETKEEGKIFSADEGLVYEKTMQRDVGLYETAIYHRAGTTIVTTGIQAIQRDATDTFAADVGVDEDSYKEVAGPGDSSRREVGYFATSYFGADQHVNTQLGVHINQVILDENDSETSVTEVKLQTAWDAIIADEASIFLNLTWDLDQLQTDFPYDERTFSPWGGGNIQFLAVF